MDSAPRRRQIQPGTGRFTIRQGDLGAAAGGVRLIQFDAKQLPHSGHQRLPLRIAVVEFVYDSKADIPEDLGGTALPDQELDLAGLLEELAVCQARHRREEHDARSQRLRRGGRVIERPAIKRFFVGVFESNAARPGTVPGHALDDDLDPDILNMQIFP